MTAVVTSLPDYLLAAWTKAEAGLTSTNGHAEKRAAWERFVARGLPGRREEAWRNLSFDGLRDGTFKPASSNHRVEKDAHTSGSTPVPETVTAGAALLKDDGDPFLALSEALSDATLRFAVPAGVDAGCLHLVHEAPPGSAVMPRLQVVLGRGARLELFEEYRGGAAAWTNGLTEITLEADASLGHVRWQREAGDSLHTGRVAVDQARDSRYHGSSVVTGGGLTRVDIQVRLREPGSECDLLGLYAVRNQQSVDHHTALDHAAPNTTSRQLYKGILDDRARGVFNGHIHIAPHSQQVVAEQSNRNLLLSETALVNTNPQLEIHADDVKCRHGATVGQLDASQLFYLRSRGIDEERARELLTRAFLLEVAHALRPSGVVSEVEADVSARFFDRG